MMMCQISGGRTVQLAGMTVSGKFLKNKPFDAQEVFTVVVSLAFIGDNERGSVTRTCPESHVNGECAEKVHRFLDICYFVLYYIP